MMPNAWTNVYKNTKKCFLIGKYVLFCVSSGTKQNWKNNLWSQTGFPNMLTFIFLNFHKLLQMLKTF